MVSTSQSLAVQARAELVRMDHSAHAPTGSLSRAGSASCALLPAQAGHGRCASTLADGVKPAGLRSPLPPKLPTPEATDSRWKELGLWPREPWVHILTGRAPRCGAWGDLLLLSSGLSPFVNKDGLREPAPGVFGMKRKAQRELENGTETSVTDDHRGFFLVDSAFGPAGPWARSLAPARCGRVCSSVLRPPSPCKAAALFLTSQPSTHLRA